jgi:hypothetical protein
MYQIQVILIVFILILFASAYPILSLKYHSDLYEYTDRLNSQCSKQKEEKEKNKYVWQISNYFYDFSSLNIDKNKESAKNNGEFLDEINHMKLYISYFHSSIGQLLFFILFIIWYAIIVLYLRQEYLQKEWFHFSLLIMMFVYVILFIIIFALILKKITEIYNDTYTFEYMVFMKKLDIIISEATKESSSAFVDTDKELKDLLKNLYDTSYEPDADEKQYAVQNLVLTEDILYKLEKTYSKIVPNGTEMKDGKIVDKMADLNINKKEIDDFFFKYHQKSHKEDIQNKINTVTSYLYAYLVFLLPFLMLLFRSIDNYYIYAIILIILFIAVSAYYIYTALH